MDWIDTPSSKQRFLHSEPDFLDYLPGYEVERHQYLLENGWARLALVGPEYPDVFDDVDPAAMRRSAVARAEMLKFYPDRVMANDVQWCVAGVPTRAWASQVFPDLPGEEAVERLWQTVMQTCRVDEADPDAAWLAHDAALHRVIEFLAAKQVRSVRFVDSQLDDDGKPLTDLTVGLTDRPVLGRRRRQRRRTARCSSPTCPPRRCSAHRTTGGRRVMRASPSPRTLSNAR